MPPLSPVWGPGGNLLNYNTATIETDAFPWGATINASVSRVTSIFKSGVASLQLNGSGSGAMDTHANLGPIFEIRGGRTYTFLASVRADTTARTSYISVNWFDSNRGYITTTITAGITDSNAAWTDIVHIVPAPANAYEAQIGVQFDSVVLNEKHFVDELGAFYSTHTPPATWVEP